MTDWIFEPGHSIAHFRARHMMVTHVRGMIPNVTGRITFDPDDPASASVEATLKPALLDSGVEARDAHLKDPDFLHVEKYPEITFEGSDVIVDGANDFTVTGDLTIRGITRSVDLSVCCLGVADTPFWEDGENHGPVRRIGFEASTRIDRRTFDVDWNAPMPSGGIVVGHHVDLRIDVEALEAGVVPGFGPDA